MHLTQCNVYLITNILIFKKKFKIARDIKAIKKGEKSKYIWNKMYFKIKYMQKNRNMINI